MAGPATAAGALLTALIDYAGLFPPASLPLPEAIGAFAQYRAGPDAWALGRFVVPARQRHEIPDDFPLSVLVEDFSSIPFADVIEVKAGSAAEIEQIAAAATGRTAYVEIKDPTLLEAVAANGLRAKIRTGGVTPLAFPSAGEVAQFIVTCMKLRIVFKATAGLHHPLRCVRPLTYERGAQEGTMHGFINVFLAATLADCHKTDPSSLVATLTELLLDGDPRSFAFHSDAISWRGLRIDAREIFAARKYAISFGSCSFAEPMAELRELQWL